MKKICALCLSVLLCLGLMQPALAQTFRDVPASHWAAGVVDEMTGRGIVQGVGDGRGIHLRLVSLLACGETRVKCGVLRAIRAFPPAL